MENKENPEVDGPMQGEPAPPPVEDTSVGYGHSSTVHREHVIDRTGDLMDRAFGIADKHLRSNAVMIKDPRDGTPAHFIVDQSGVRPLCAEYFDEYRQFPLARKGTVKLTQLASFTALVNRFKNEHATAIFAKDDLTAPALTAIFDYHPSNDDVVASLADDGTSMPFANNMEHRAHYAFPLSVEWQAWFGKNEKPMSMAEFAQFLETHIVDVSDDAVSAWSEQAQAFAKANRATTPEAIATPTRLVDLSLKFRIYETAESCEAVNLTSGETQLTFVSEHKQADGKPVDFPKLFSIVIPIFARSPIYYRIIARLRYRLANGKPVFWFELWRPDLTFEQAFNEALEQVEEETSLPIFAGSPEV